MDSWLKGRAIKSHRGKGLIWHTSNDRDATQEQIMAIFAQNRKQKMIKKKQKHALNALENSDGKKEQIYSHMAITAFAVFL